MVVRESHIYEFGAILSVLIFGHQPKSGEQLHLVFFLEFIAQFLFAQLIVQLLAI
jgi:hypothetical protein